MLQDHERGTVHNLAAGEELFAEGDMSDSTYLVLTGTLRALTESDGRRVELARMGAGAVVGELAGLIKDGRTATVEAVEPSDVVELTRDAYLDWLDDHPERSADLAATARTRLERSAAADYLGRLLPDPAMAGAIIRVARWRRVRGGDVVWTVGEPAREACLVLTGRVQEQDAHGDSHIHGRGEFLGPDALLRPGSRTSTVTALRDSLVMLFDDEAFDAVTAEHPRLALHLAAGLPDLAAEHADHRERPHTIAVLCATDLDAEAWAAALADGLRGDATVEVVSSDAVDQTLGPRGIAHVAADDPLSPRLEQFLDWLEATVTFVVLLADTRTSPWTSRVLHAADLTLVIADAQPDDTQRSLLRSTVHTSSSEVWLCLRPDPSGGGETKELLHASVDRVVTLRGDGPEAISAVAGLIRGADEGTTSQGDDRRRRGTYGRLADLGAPFSGMGGPMTGGAWRRHWHDPVPHVRPTGADWRRWSTVKDDGQQRTEASSTGSGS